MIRSRSVVLGVGAALLLGLGGPTVARGQVTGWASAVGAVGEYRSNAAGAVDRSTGPLAGLQAHLVPVRLVEIDFTLLGGTFSAQNPVADDRKVAELAGRASVVAKPWLALQVGGYTRTHTTLLARERWTTLELGAEARPAFAAGPLRAILRASLMPVVAVTGAANPNLAFAGATGLEWHGSHFTAAFTYTVERYDFPRAGTFKRAEQLSMLGARVGWVIGARPRAR